MKKIGDLVILFILVSISSTTCKPLQNKSIWDIIKTIKYATPLKALKINFSKVGIDSNWYQVSENLYFYAGKFKPYSGIYLDDPEGPFVIYFTWFQCKSAMLYLINDIKSFQCNSAKFNSSSDFPSNFYFKYGDLITKLGDDYWDQSAYNINDKFLYRTITDKSGTYKYYFAVENPKPDDYPFAITYLLEKERP